MKRKIAILLALVMGLSCLSTAFADITVDSEQSANTTVTYGVETQYTVIIPDSIYLDEEGMNFEEISVYNALLPSGSTLNISVVSNNFDVVTDSWYLIDEKNSANMLPYEIVSKDYGSVKSGDVVYTLPTNQNEYTMAIDFALLAEATIAGTYTDQITFEVALDKESNNSITGTYLLYNKMPTDDMAVYLDSSEIPLTDDGDVDVTNLTPVLVKYGVPVQLCINNTILGEYPTCLVTPWLVFDVQIAEGPLTIGLQIVGTEEGVMEGNMVEWDYVSPEDTYNVILPIYITDDVISNPYAEKLIASLNKYSDTVQPWISIGMRVYEENGETYYSVFVPEDMTWGEFVNNRTLCQQIRHEISLTVNENGYIMDSATGAWLRNEETFMPIHMDEIISGSYCIVLS